MKTLRNILPVLLAATFGAAQAQTVSDADARYVGRIDGRYASFAGSTANLESLATGLRHGTQIRLTGSGESVTLAPPTRPMGYGNVTRTLDLASRELASLGITDPTPKEISAALNGGTVHTATGDVSLKGILQLRSDGMGWGQIAHAIGVHPGMGLAKNPPAPASVPAASASGITTASGHAVVRPGPGAGQGPKSTPTASHSGTVTSAAGAASAPGLSKGAGNANGQGKAAGRI